MRFAFLIGPACLAAVLSCSVRLPEVVNVTGEKTSLEREILGTYSLMREDTWMAASTRAPAPAPPSGSASMSPEKRRSLEALQEQAFNRDDVEEFKTKGWVGESNDGRLVVRASVSADFKPEDMRFVEDILAEENNDRAVILNRVVELNDALKRAVPRDVAAVFARMYQDNSPGGTWVQKPDGAWSRK
jgi:uncharacterized protein YdbL (DUF1318 family)